MEGGKTALGKDPQKPKKQIKIIQGLQNQVKGPTKATSPAKTVVDALKMPELPPPTKLTWLQVKITI